MEKGNLSLEQDFLSDIELYYTTPDLVSSNSITVKGDECKHIAKVMRHQIDDILYVTSGVGEIYKTKIEDISKSEILASVLETYRYKNKLSKFTFCIPRLRSQDRFEFAIEKCIELGISNFVIYTADRSVAKGEKLDRWNKVALSAMKQSLRSYLPKIEYKKSLKEILNTESEVIYFDQNSEKLFIENVNFLIENNKSYFLIFGPEGGISEEEKELLKDELSFQLTANRLRAETAIISSASVIAI